MILQDDCLWAVLAAAASHAKNISAAEIAYGAIDEVEKKQKKPHISLCLTFLIYFEAEKVYFLRTLKNSNNKDIRNGEISLFCGNVQDAELSFLQSGHVFRAIFTNVLLYRWDK